MEKQGHGNYEALEREEAMFKKNFVYKKVFGSHDADSYVPPEDEENVEV